MCAPSGVAVDANNNLYITETRNHVIRRVDGNTGVITTVAGNRSPTPTGDGSPPTNVAIIHPWGIAIDLESERYPLGSKARFPDAVVAVFRDAGFFYGGDFASRKDPMHFQFCKGY